MNRLQTFVAAMLLTATVGALAQVSGIPSQLSVESLTTTGDVTVGGTLNAAGSAITSLNAANITSGKLDRARLKFYGSRIIATAGSCAPELVDQFVSCSYTAVGKYLVTAPANLFMCVAQERAVASTGQGRIYAVFPTGSTSVAVHQLDAAAVSVDDDFYLTCIGL